MAIPQTPRYSLLVAVAALLALVPAGFLHAQTKTYPLDSAEDLELHNVSAKPVTFKGRKALQVTISPEMQERLEAAAARRKTGPRPKKKGGPGERGPRVNYLAIIEGSEFSDGTIEVDLAGEPAPGTAGGARGFVGIAWRVQPDKKTYDAFYLRPTNGRAENQERRNHSAQYISHPTYTWFKLRRETPSRYESYVDLVPGEWTKVKIEVRGEKARLYVHGNAQPTLIVNDVKSGPNGKGAIALWIEGSTVAHFANLRVSK